jgi:hypothetical protein
MFGRSKWWIDRREHGGESMSRSVLHLSFLKIIAKYTILLDVDILSTSSIHQGVSTVDFSLKIQPKSKPIAQLIVSGADLLEKDVQEIMLAVSLSHLCLLFKSTDDSLN